MLWILGAGGLGREIAATVRGEAAFLDDDERLWGKQFHGAPVRGSIGPLLRSWDFAIAGVGFPEVKQRLVGRVESLGACFEDVVHDRAVLVEGDVFIEAGTGCFLAAGAVLTVNVRLGAHVHVLNNATIGHDSQIGDFSTICPNASVSGYCKIGTGVFIGAGAVILPDVEVGDWAVVGAGAIVTHDVRSGVTVVGNPARELEAT